MAGGVSAVGVVAAVAAAALGLAVAAGAAAQAQRIAGIADAAALAAADTVSGAIPGVPCEAAAAVADAGGANLDECDVDGLVATVAVGSAYGGIPFAARSRAGPPDVSTAHDLPEPDQEGVCMVCNEERTPVANGKKLVIVESPTKMKSIQGYLGDGYEVLSSVGHIRDLASKKEIPADKKAAYGKYSIDVENDFDPYYVVNDRKTKTVAELKRALKEADELWLATDEDREVTALLPGAGTDRVPSPTLYGQIPGLEQQHLCPASGGIAGDPSPVHAAADYCQVELHRHPIAHPGRPPAASPRAG